MDHTFDSTHFLSPESKQATLFETEKIEREESLIGKPKRRREIQLRIILEDRVLKGDLILKTILRKMRKTFLEEFNSMTKYSSTKRHKNHEYLVECLHKFCKERFETEEDSFWNDDMILTLGSLFYPKIMKQIYPSASS